MQAFLYSKKAFGGVVYFVKNKIFFAYQFFKLFAYVLAYPTMKKHLQVFQ